VGFHRVRTPSLLAFALLAACQDYTFDPVQQCLIQPGSTQVKLAATSSADILFVVDDSPSMDPKQQALADNFGTFIARMVQTNTDRVANGLDPIDFHIAVTNTSIFMANPSGRFCRAGSGGDECCAPSGCADAACTPGTADGCGTGEMCVVADVLASGGSIKIGEQTRCCAASACTAAAPDCFPGRACAAMQTSYPAAFSGGCTPGLAVPGAAYAKGAFQAAPGNPAVLNFDKSLDWASWGGPNPDPLLTALVQEFRENIKVGSCGSGEEQHLEAGRLALELAQEGKQPGVAAGTWPHPGAKLVVVFVGDEDDCSSRAEQPLVFSASAPGADSCVYDKRRPSGSQQIPVGEYARFLRSLVHTPGGAADLAAAFIVSGVACQDGSFSPADSCSGTPLCPVAPTCTPAAPVCAGAFAAGERFHALAQELRGMGTQVVEGSVCAAFGPLLAAIADLVPPPSFLELDTRPAASEVTLLRIGRADGSTRRLCQQGADWCFVSCADGSSTPTCLAPGATSRCIAITPGSGCRANPGELYSADYIGMLPADGCATAADCTSALGDRAAWACYTPQGQDRGTCVCGQ
jgi:hypothetical protein